MQKCQQYETEIATEKWKDTNLQVLIKFRQKLSTQGVTNTFWEIHKHTEFVSHK
jgi:hypothetical protein